MNKNQRRIEILKLHFQKYSNRLISKKLNIPKQTINEDIKRFYEIGDFCDRKRIRKPTVATQSLIQKLNKKLKKKPRCSLRKVSKEIKVNRETVRNIVKNKLKLKPYKMNNCS